MPDDVVEGQVPETDVNEVAETPDGQVPDDDLKLLRLELRRAREEAAKYRKERKDAKTQMEALKNELGRALGVDSEDMTPEKLKGDLEEVKRQLRQERITNVFVKLAGALDADPDLTMAYLSHRGLLSDIDPEDEDFAMLLEERVKGALKAVPKLKASVTVANRSGAEFKEAGKKSNEPDMNAFLRRAAGLQ